MKTYSNTKVNLKPFVERKGRNWNTNMNMNRNGVYDTFNKERDLNKKCILGTANATATANRLESSLFNTSSNAMNSIKNKQLNMHMYKEPIRNANSNHKIDININLNYPKDKVNKRHISSLLDKRSNRVYQNNLNISLTNYSNQHNTENSTTNKNMLGSKSSSSSISSLLSSASACNTNTNVFFASKNMKEFTLKDNNINSNTNSNEQTAFFNGEFNKASFIYIKNCLIDQLELLNHDPNTKDKGANSLHKKYSLYNNALMQLSELSSNEEEKELLNVITLGLSNIMSSYKRKEEQLTMHNVMLKKHNERKDTQINKLKEEIRQLKNNHKDALNTNSNSNTKDNNNEVLKTMTNNNTIKPQLNTNILNQRNKNKSFVLHTKNSQSVLNKCKSFLKVNEYIKYK